MTKKVFKLLSFVLHPVFIPLIGVLLIFSMSHLALLPFESKKAIVYLVAIVTVFFPLAIIPILYYQKIITGVQMSTRRERLVPMFITSLFYLFGYYILNRYSAPFILQQYMLAVFISVLVASVINIGWKISLHMIGIGGLIGLLSSLEHLYGLHVNWVLMMAILVAGIIGTVRLYLKEHDAQQIYGGFMIGYALNFGVIVLFNL
ncbi:MAG: hypothetical protein PF517_06430 [Salinivirgaceae bacterium]|jgi:hypothetical protein|nr:hypothetical protein [Salinivirgaceae bacterium]